MDSRTSGWFGVPDRDTHCWHWLAFMTAEELGWPVGSKLTLDRVTGEILDEPPSESDSPVTAA